jgi:hypothetical protein
MPRPFLSVTRLLCSALLIAACAGAPVQEMSDARQAIQAAEDAGADPSERGPLREAQQMLQKAEQQLELGQYGEARRNAIEAKDKALQSREEALEFREAR